MKFHCHLGEYESLYFKVKNILKNHTCNNYHFMYLSSVPIILTNLQFQIKLIIEIPFGICSSFLHASGYCFCPM